MRMVMRTDAKIGVKGPLTADLFVPVAVRYAVRTNVT